MKTRLAEDKFKSDLGIVGRLFSRITCLGTVILVCTSAFAQNLFVSGTDANGGEIFKFTWDAKQSIFAFGHVPSGQAPGETFSHVAFQSPACCQTATLTATPMPRLSPTPRPRPTPFLRP